MRVNGIRPRLRQTTRALRGRLGRKAYPYITASLEPYIHPRMSELEARMRTQEQTLLAATRRLATLEDQIIQIGEAERGTAQIQGE